MSNATPPAVKNVLADLTPGDRKKEFVKKLRQMKATTVTNAATTEDVAKRLGCTRQDVYALVAGTAGKAGSSPTCLLATGHVKVAKTEEGLAVYLTKAGQTADFKDRPFAAVVAASKVEPKKATPTAKKPKSKTVQAVADGTTPVEVEASVA